MRILIITSLYPDDSPIKTTYAVHDLVRFWTDRHEIICFKEDWFFVSNLFRRKKVFEQIKSLVGYKYCEKENVKIYRFTSFGNPFANLDIRFLKKIISKIMAYKMNKLLKNIEKPDIVIAHMPVINVVDYIKYLNLDCPKVAVLHRGDIDWLDVDRFGKKIVQNKINDLNNGFSAIFSRSLPIYKYLLNLHKVNNLKNVIISSGVPQSEIIYERNWDTWQKRKKHILYVGELIKQKGVDKIIESLSLIREDFEFDLTIIGEGNELDSLHYLCKNVQVEKYVNFIGQKSRDEVYYYMSTADIFVMPSWHETLGLVYLEAMSNGCITIGSKNEGIDGIIVDNQNGFLVKPLDIGELTECFVNIMTMKPEDLCIISKNAKETANEYTLKKRSDIYINEIINILNKEKFNEKYF